MELGTLVAPVQGGGDVAWRTFGRGVELGCAGLDPSPLLVVKAFDCDAVFAVDLGDTIGLDLFLFSFARHLNYGTCSIVQNKLI